MSSSSLGPNMHQPSTIEVPDGILDPHQLSLVESLASLDDTNPGHDLRTAVAARFLLEEQLAWGVNLPASHEGRPVSYGDYQSTLKNNTRGARLTALLEQRVQQRSVPIPEDPNDFHSLMAAHAALDIEAVLRHNLHEALENQALLAIGQIGVCLSDAQIRWEVSHGTVNSLGHRTIHILDKQGERLSETSIRLVRNAFRREPTSNLTPEAIARTLFRATSPSPAGTMISELVAGGVLRRNIERNTLSLEPLFHPVRRPSLSAVAKRILRITT